MMASHPVKWFKDCGTVVREVRDWKYIQPHNNLEPALYSFDETS